MKFTKQNQILPFRWKLASPDFLDLGAGIGFGDAIVVFSLLRAAVLGVLRLSPIVVFAAKIPPGLEFPVAACLLLGPFDLGRLLGVRTDVTGLATLSRRRAVGRAGIGGDREASEADGG
jgi:hypothetical protein